MNSSSLETSINLANDSGYNSVCSETEMTIRSGITYSSTPYQAQRKEVSLNEPIQSPVMACVRRDLLFEKVQSFDSCSTPCKSAPQAAILAIKRVHLNEKSLASVEKQILRQLYNNEDEF